MAMNLPNTPDEPAEDEEVLRYSDSELVNLIRAELRNTETDDAATVQEQRRNSFRAYYGDSPKKAAAGRSSHVSREVFDAVESIKSKMMRIFTSNKEVVKFKAEGTSPEAAKEAKFKTAYVNHLFHVNNPGYELLEDAFHDALLNKLCVFKSWWNESEEKEIEEVNNVPKADLDNYLAQNPDAQIKEVTGRQIIPQIVNTPFGRQQIPTEYLSADIEKTVDTSYSRCGILAPEDFFMGNRSTAARDSDFMCDRAEYTKQELISFGFDPLIVGELSRDASLLSEYTDNARRSVDRTWRSRHDFSRQDDRELVYVWDIYIMLDLNEDGIPEWWQIIIGGDKVLSKEQVKGHPYRVWSPYSISHKGIGMSVADVTIDLQRTMSSIIRGGVDNVWLTNNSQKAANLQALTNPQDLISGRIGAIIDTPDPRGIVPIQQPQLNASTFVLYEKLEQQKESRTGDSRLSRGLNGDAVSSQNAEDMINKLMSASNERIVQMARSFAEKCFKPLLNDLYSIGVENNEAVQAIFQGEKQSIDPRQTQWDPKSQTSLIVALTPEEQAAQAQTILTVHGVLSQDEELKPIYGLEQKYAMVTDALDLLGVNNPTYLADPSDPQVQQRIQKQQAEMQQKMQMAEAEQRQAMQTQIQLAVAAQATRDRAQNTTDARVAADMTLDTQRLGLDAVTKSDSQALDERQFDHDVMQDGREFELEKTQKRPVAI